MSDRKRFSEVSAYSRGGERKCGRSRELLSYANVSTAVLHGTLMSFTALDILPRQREAIAYELAVRAWAEAVEARLSTTIAWCRGGRS